MDLRIDKRNALVCGASKGIGRAIALQLAEMGANVTVLARNSHALQEVVDEMSQYGGAHEFLTADFSEPEKVIEDINTILDGGMEYQILVNNTGGPAPGPVNIAKPVEFYNAFTRHLIMSQLLVQALLPGMKNSEFGRIINVISIGVKQPIENLGVSNTLRGAMASWAKTLSREIGQYGITVNNLLPGHTKTERLDSLISNRAKNENRCIEEIENEIMSQNPIGRLGLPEELAAAAGFLASEQAAFITGINLPVDGGFLRAL